MRHGSVQEGGCDWGESNIFFFSKLGLLLVINATFLVAWHKSIRGVARFAPHLAAALVLAALTWSGGRCDTYYAHPNGSIGQMVIEAAAFAVLGMQLLRRWAGGATSLVVAVLAAWNAVHVVVFYAWLTIFSHWTWWHTWAVTGSLLFVGLCVSPSETRHPRVVTEGTSLDM
jgi:hypothetical protein